jgi:hypothetical protein
MEECERRNENSMKKATIRGYFYYIVIFLSLGLLGAIILSFSWPLAFLWR